MPSREAELFCMQPRTAALLVVLLTQQCVHFAAEGTLAHCGWLHSAIDRYSSIAVDVTSHDTACDGVDRSVLRQKVGSNFVREAARNEGRPVCRIAGRAYVCFTNS